MVEFSWTSFGEANPEREYLALVTYIPRKSRLSILGFFQHSRRIQEQLKESKGLVGYSLRAQLWGKNGWTLSVWENEAALREFVGKAPHVDTMRELGPKLGQERKFVRWKLRGSEVPPTWDQALERLQASGEAYGSRPT